MDKICKGGAFFDFADMMMLSATLRNALEIGGAFGLVTIGTNN